MLEALSSGVPALITDEGGPQFIVREGVTGYVCRDNSFFVRRILKLKQSPDDLANMRARARRYAEGASWDTIFEAVYRTYDVALKPAAAAGMSVHTKLPARSYTGP